MNGGALSSMMAKGGIVGKDGRRVSSITIHPRGYTHHYEGGGSVDYDHDDAPMGDAPTPAQEAVTSASDSTPGVNLGNSSFAPTGGMSSPNIGSMAATDEGSAFKSSGGGGGGGGGMAMLAMLADGGEVNLGTPGYTAPGSVGSPSIGGMASTDTGGSAFQSPASKGDGKKGGQGGGLTGKLMGGLGKKKQPGEAEAPYDPNAPQTVAPGASMGNTSTIEGPSVYEAKGGYCEGPYDSHVMNYLHGGEVKGKSVPAMVSPGEVYLTPDQVKQVVESGANPMSIGKHIKGKAKVKNDSLKNDTVPTTLEEGGMVIPRHITTHKMAPEKAELFVHRSLAKRRVK